MNEIVKQGQEVIDYTSIFNFRLKNLKRMLPSACTFLGVVKLTSGEYKVRAIVKDEYRYSIPQDFNLTNEHYDRLFNLIKKRCDELREDVQPA